MKTSAISQQAHHDAHKSSQEKIKNKRLQSQIGLILKLSLSSYSRFPGGSTNSQSCDKDFIHVNSPCAFARIFILREYIYATGGNIFRVEK